MTRKWTSEDRCPRSLGQTPQTGFAHISTARDGGKRFALFFGGGSRTGRESLGRSITRARGASLRKARSAPAARGCGRPRRKGKRNVAHRSREPFTRTTAFHVTLRMKPHVFSLRSGRSQRVVEKMLSGHGEAFGTRVVQLSVQGDHIHLLIEAPSHIALGKAMKGLGVRLARGMNKVMRRRGRVLGDRYHARPLRTPTELRNAVHYIRHNHRKHEAANGRRLPPAFVDPCSSDGKLAAYVRPATLYLLRRTLAPPPGPSPS